MAKVISSSVKKATLETTPDPERTEERTEAASPQRIAQDETRLGGYAYRIIRKQTQAIAEARSLVLSDKDPENLHQMRIATRRLSAAVLIFQDVVSISSKKKQKSPEKLAKSIKKLTHVLGGVRDMDVLGAWFANALKKEEKRLSKKEKKTIRALLKVIKKRRKKRFAKLSSFLQGDRYSKTMRPFKQWIKQPSFTETAHSEASVAAAAKIIDPIARLLKHPAWTIASHEISEGDRTYLAPIPDLTLAQLNGHIAQGGDEQLHDLRKQIKNVRYQAEFFRGLYGIAYASQVREFRTLQKLLGGLQDQIVIGQFLADEIGSNWDEKLPTLAADFQSRLALWQQWQPYQQKYLKLSSRLCHP